MTETPVRHFPQLGDWGDEEQLQRIQDKRLPEVMRGVSGSSFYRERLAEAGPVTSVADLDRMPVITKRDLRAAYPFGLLAVERTRLATYHESSGTSGKPTSSFFTAADWLDVVDRFTRSSIELSPRDTMLVRTPYAMLPTGHQAHQGALYKGATVIPADNRSLIVTHSRVVQLLHELDVTVTWCLPTECLLWAAAAREAGLRPDKDFPSLRGFMAVGEPLSAARRRRIEQLWGEVPVVQDYGSTETGSLAGECRAGQLHLWADRFIPQVYDPATGRSSRTGTGELTITTLYREAMPLVRYNLEDYVRISDPDCSCGWQLPVLEVIGRDVTSCVVGDRRVTQGQLDDLVFTLPQRYDVMFWRARVHGDRLEIEFEVAEENQQVVARELTSAIRSTLGIEARPRGVPHGSILPTEVLTRNHDFVKPRNLFGAHEDWDKAVSYW